MDVFVCCTHVSSRGVDLVRPPYMYRTIITGIVTSESVSDRLFAPLALALTFKYTSRHWHVCLISWDLCCPIIQMTKDLFSPLRCKLFRPRRQLESALKHTVPCQAEARAVRVWERGVPSVTGRFYVTIFKGSPSLLSGVLHDVEVSNVFQD